ncbi:FAD/NAD-P-binding domain-containing protein [Trametes polyzona]|nr:FAD/NAD-P-binding domain-containing protein [Trametes polyzona]
MLLPERADVVIIGGGPTGLCHALSLYNQNLTDVIIVDGALQGDTGSRAVVIHAATLEALEKINCVDPILNACQRIRATVIRSTRYTIETGTFAPLAKYTKYPFMTAIPQHITEKIIGDEVERRGIRVYRPHKVVDLKPNAENPLFTDVIFEDGHVLRARCVVGADGSHSIVRERAQLKWADPDGEPDDEHTNLLSQMIIADVTLENPPDWPRDTVNLAVSGGNICLFIALPGRPYEHAPEGETVFRVGCGIPPELGAPPHAPDAEYVQKALDAWGPNRVLPPDAPRVVVKQVPWSSRFRTRSSIVDTYFARLPTEVSPAGTVVREGGPILLIGDAAHIHPPIGGQGMNLGIRDAVRLGPVLAEFLRDAPAEGLADDVAYEPLRKWAEERHTHAKAVIKMVKGLGKMLAIPDKTQWVLGIIPVNPSWVRDTFLSFMCMFQWWRARSAYLVSGLGNP